MKKIIFVLLFFCFQNASQLNLEVTQITQSLQSNFTNPISKLTYRLFSILHDTYIWIKITYPINVLVILVLTLYIMCILLQLIKALVFGLFGTDKVFDIQDVRQAQSLSEGIKSLQKELGDIKKTMVTYKQGVKQQIKENAGKEKTAEIIDPSNEKNLIRIDSLEEKMKFNNVMQNQIHKGCQDMVTKLRRWNSKDQSSS